MNIGDLYISINLLKLGIVTILVLFIGIWNDFKGISRNDVGEFLYYLDFKWLEESKYIAPSSLFKLILGRVINSSRSIWLNILIITYLLVGSVAGYTYLKNYPVQQISTLSVFVILMLCTSLSSLSVHLSILTNISTNKYPLLELCNPNAKYHDLLYGEKFEQWKFTLCAYRINSEKFLEYIDDIVKSGDNFYGGNTRWQH